MKSYICKSETDYGECLSDEATLFLLKDKLDRVRKARRNSSIGVFVTIIIVGLFWNNYLFWDFTVGLMLAIILGTSAALLINGHYNQQRLPYLDKYKTHPEVIPID